MTRAAELQMRLMNNPVFETDRHRVMDRVPQFADVATAAAFTGILAEFDPDGITAVMRPLQVTSVAHLRGFMRGCLETLVTGMDWPAYYPVNGSTPGEP